MAKVTILSKQSIMPSQPTCNFHPSISLSLLDQLSPPIYIHILFFYSTYLPDTSEKLKSSLSQTLKYFYPLAGRIKETGKGKLHVECNDKGVEFNETRVTGVSLESIRKGPAYEFDGIGRFSDFPAELHQVKPSYTELSRFKAKNFNSH
ncbi:salutaridinol 7-O-acetyltransferase-like protein [Carex littledalei]|uniref:Salutaridinol 7-O-acetyltransferase-like protein n=1 Tax=Carex littledalei TaxID=544730 RepID=A0A833VSV4_9POAL|nr:salutaridinol 7-O-acetyltransferase-like protein [Carex littledalei]